MSNSEVVPKDQSMGMEKTGAPSAHLSPPRAEEDHDYALFGPTKLSTSEVTSEGSESFELFPATTPLKADEDSFTLFPSAVSDTAPTSLTASSSSVSSTLEYTPDTAAMRQVQSNPIYKAAGNAVDVIAVRSMENQLFTTSWHVVFSWSRWRSNQTAGVGDEVRVLINGKELQTKMQLLERGRCIFATGGLTPPVEDLLHVELYDDRINHIRFEHHQRSSGTIRYVDSRLHVWGPNESVVVADLDGTLTISDVEGHIRTLRLGQYDFLHKGACDFFTKLHELDLKIVYLTARPIDWASASRTHLENATQHAHSLPPGPLITNSNGLRGALMTEVVNKNPHVFKTQVLNEIQLTLIHAGRVTEHPVFVAGFGNRPTDVIAYKQVGMEESLIFLIDPYSNLRSSDKPRIYESYDDPNVMLWLLPKLKHQVPLEKVQRIDDYTMRELVLAEEREQLLIAEMHARRLQEEEYARAGKSSYY